MKTVIKNIFFVFLLWSITSLTYAKIKVIAAENVYGDIISTLGGDAVQVISVLQYPDQDPHLFSTNPKLAQEFSEADLIVANGLGYDTWMDHLVQSSSIQKKYIRVDHLMGRQLGDNPHLWYDPKMLPIFSKFISKKLCEQNKSQIECGKIQERLKNLLTWHQAWLLQIQKTHQQFSAYSVLASEPVIGLLSDAMGFRMQGLSLQWAVMNGSSPSPSAIREVTDLLNHRVIKLFFYNTQVQNPFTQSLKQLALRNHVRVVGVSETMPPGIHYQIWMQRVVDQIQKSAQ